MKASHALPPALLLAGLLTGAGGPTASAQTPLLEVDYQNNPVFHVRSDGTVYLPLGAQAGYVLTTDADGHGSWQPVPGNGGAVNSDATLTGDGTAGNPLGVAVPLVLTGTNTNGQVRGEHTGGNYGFFGSGTVGAYGQNANGHYGYLGSSSGGVFGFNANGNQGSLGLSTVGAYGRHTSGNEGYFGGSTYGAYGEHNSGHFGALGHEDYGAYGEHDNGTFGYLGGIHNGVWGEHADGQFGVLGGVSGASGVYGEHDDGQFGFFASSLYGAWGQHNNGNFGALGDDQYGVWGNGTPWAGYFQGNVHVTGTLTGGTAASKVDHPLDPEGQYLVHSTVESPDMKTVYDDIVTLDAAGEAVVALPDYFETLNRDFRYQLTTIGGFAPVYVAEEIQGNRFTIAGGAPGMKVSWQVTGIRQDPWAEQHRLVVEEAKPAAERGYYLHPALYGQPAERGVEWARHPEGMQETKEMPARMEEQRRQMEQERRRIQAERERREAEHKPVQAEREPRPARPGSGQRQ